MKKILLLLAVAGVLVWVGVTFPVADNKVVQGQQGVQGIKGDRGPVGPAGPQGLRGFNGRDGKDATPQLGAFPGPDIYLPYLGLNDVRVHTSRLRNLAQATSTVCALQAPVGATSTLLSYGFKLTESTSTADAKMQLSVHKQDFQFGTTSASVEIASTTISNGKIMQMAYATSIDRFGDFAENNFDPEVKELSDMLFTPVGDRASNTAQNLVFTLISSNNDSEASVGQPHDLNGTCEAVWLEL